MDFPIVENIPRNVVERVLKKLERLYSESTDDPFFRSELLGAILLLREALE